VVRRASGPMDLGVAKRALLLTPSSGLGGGIERYVETLEWSFDAVGVEHRRISLVGAGMAAHSRMLAQGRQELRAMAKPTRLVVAHRALLPVASRLAADPTVPGISVICHGSDIWGVKQSLRWYYERHLMRQAHVRVVAVSSFTSGVLSGACPSSVLPPGLSMAWFNMLVKASTSARFRAPGAHLVTVFRLGDWQDKGLPELLEAAASLGRPDISVTVCGSGNPSSDLCDLVVKYPACSIRAELTDGELADQLASADLFVLATRTRSGRNPCGEGFGLVLLEAQVAGTPVIAPGHGGSHDAYVEGVTGMAPTDESVPALASVLRNVLGQPDRLAQMSKSAADWSRESFAPGPYAELAARRLL
jgi:glycosyltransferase involved in cell wall biosynthesis